MNKKNEKKKINLQGNEQSISTPSFEIQPFGPYK